MDRVKRRGHPLRRWRQLDRRGPVRRRPLARTEQEPQPDLDEPEVDEVVTDYDIDAIRLNYSAWGCSPPPTPPDRRMD